MISKLERSDLGHTAQNDPMLEIGYKISNLIGENMEEKDLKLFEASQPKPPFDHNVNHHYSSNDKGELHEGEDLDQSKQEMSSCNMQQGVEEYACTQAIIDLKFYDKKAGEVLPQLKLSDDKEECIEECKEDAQTTKTEPGNQLTACELSESHCVQEQLLCLMDELKTVNKDLNHMKSELIAALRQADLFEASLTVEKEKNKKLLMHISELNDVILSSDEAAIKAEEERTAFFRGIDAELEIAAVAVSQSQQQLEETKGQLDIIKYLENELIEKTHIIDSLQIELNHAKVLQNSTANPITVLNQLKSDIEVIERGNAEKSCYITSIETEMKKKEGEIQWAREKNNNLNLQIEVTANEMQHLKSEASKSADRELQFQVEIATLRSELHKGRSRIAAAEAAKIKATSSQSGLYLAVQQLAVEAEAAKNEARRLKQEIDDCWPKMKKEDDLSKGKSEEGFITASTEICSPESLVPKLETADRLDEPINDGCQCRSETHMLKEKLEAANSEISGLRFHLEEALSRVELAEKAKEAIEEKHRKWKEKQQQRRVAAEARREQTARRFGIVTSNNKPQAHHQQPVTNTKSSDLPGHEERNTLMYDGKDPKLITLGMILNIKI